MAGNMAKTWNQVFGIVLVLIGVLGFMSPTVYGLFPDSELTLVTKILYTFAGAWVAYLGFTGSEGSWRKSAQYLGIVGLVAGVLGFVYPSLLETLQITDGLRFNIVHLLIGVTGAYVGWGMKHA